ncbi:MAG: hypothetical protein IJJ10_02030 [Bacillus sp. (in: Bacteria)]|nr:hypothetical protein [Bacillus sp. (in: firmicutes)]
MASGNIVNFEGKTDFYSSLEELENASDIIIKGEKKSETETNVIRSEIDGEVAGGYTLSNFEITKVYKNSLNDKEIKEQNTVKISEVSFYDEETHSAYTINGYQNMKKNNEYLLFLSKEEDGNFITKAVTFGKIPLNTNDLEISSDENGELDQNVYLKIFNAAKEKYN